MFPPSFPRKQARPCEGKGRSPRWRPWVPAVAATTDRVIHRSDKALSEAHHHHDQRGWCGETLRRPDAMTGAMARTTRYGPTSDFSPIASRYDLTRDIPQRFLETCYERLHRQGLLPARGIVLDAGCGTGQISLPLAGLGYAVCGVDVSADMLRVARAKRPPDGQAHYIVADVRSLPLRDDCVDAVVVSKLFQHVHDWERACRELLRALQPGGCIVNLNERGAFGNRVRKYFAGRADALGFTQRYPGLRDRGELAKFLLAAGCARRSIDVTDLTWEKRIAYGEALRHLEDRLHSEFWYLPRAVYAELLADTSRWIEQQPEGPETVERLTPCLVVEIFQKPAAG